jgi:hypothetical protein
VRREGARAMECAETEKLTHVPGKPVIVVDPETKKQFKRICCNDCGRWLGDEFIKE